MFEKEAEEYGNEYWDCLVDSDDREMLQEAYKDGAEFGYNKAKIEFEKNNVVIRGFKLDDGKIRCELCSKPCLPKELGTLTVTHKDTGKTETHKVCLECGKKLGAEE